MSRALRRHHRRRVIERRRKHYWGYYDTPTRRGKLAKTAKVCSCYGCSRNWARRHLGRVTRKEELAVLSEEEQVQELLVILEKLPHYKIDREIGDMVLDVLHAWAASLKAGISFQHAKNALGEKLRHLR